MHGRQQKSPICVLHSGDVKTKQVQKFDYLARVAMDDKKWGTEIQRHIGIMKDVWQSKQNTKKT